MENFAKLSVDARFYNEVEANLINQNKRYSELIVGARKKLYHSSTLIATHSATNDLELGDLTINQFNSFLGMFQKHLYSQFLKNPALYDLKYTFTGTAREKNIPFWDSLKEGTFFYNVDLESAYWQIAYKLGYISQKVFEAYQPFDEYKQVKRYCISFLAREVKKKYNTPEKSEVIRCDTSALNQVFENIRAYLYLSIKEALEGCSDFLEYNIDGVTVMSCDLDNVRSNLNRMGLRSKTTQCLKLSDTDYLYGCKQRKFKNK